MTDTVPPSFLEDAISKQPALELLQKLGWTYLPPEETVRLRGGRRSSVLLDGILEAQLRQLNRIRYKGEEYAFSEGNIQTALMALRDIGFDGVVRTNEKVYDLLTLGKSLPQTIRGDTKSFPLVYIDWQDLGRNVFHVTEEYEVERPGSHETRRPDLVLFVNGIPLGVIECKRPDLKDAIAAAVSQMIRNQRDDEIPKLFGYAQLLLALSKNEAKYATVGTPAKFWAVWKEDTEAAVQKVLGRNRTATPQDVAVYALCRPERLMELAFDFTLFDAGEKKVARYQQYFCVKKIVERIRTRDGEGKRQGGVVWHTQGSGKSLTMVMLARAIARMELPDYKIVLVTDRVDLDDQIYGTFKSCGIEPVQATTGKNLAEILSGPRSRVVTTIIDKFEAAVAKSRVEVASPNVFVLVDEGHRGQYGAMHGRMRKALPNACFIGFTGTPVMKKEKDTISRFGGLIDSYTIRQAVADGAVVPLLYEGRDVEQHVDRSAIDRWFDVITRDLTPEQRRDLKKKFTSTDQLNKAEQKVKEIALDISTHFRKEWHGTGYKAQLVTPDKQTALLYKKYLDEFGMVTSEVLISAPDDREGNEEVNEENRQEVVAFWKRMMTLHGSEDRYNKNVINAFKHGDDPEIIIVVDKLLTGFDAPKNTVLYLTRLLKEHTLLQAIARVNRLCEGKDFGYIIDYRGVLQSLNSAFDLYGQLEQFDRDDLADTITDVAEEIRKLPARHSDLWAVFKGLRNKKDEEQYERHLADEALRQEFYEQLSLYARTLAVAFSSTRFMEQTPEEKLQKYRDDLKFFMQLRSAVKRRYAEVVDFKEYEAKIRKLIDTHVGTGQVETITSLVNIFDKDAFQREVERIEGTASKADTIAHRTKKTIIEKMQEDPAFYRRFSELLEDAIRAFRERRLADRDYLAQVMDIAEKVRNRTGDDLPEKLRNQDVAQAFYGELQPILQPHAADTATLKAVSADVAVGIDEIIRRFKIVNWTTNADVQNRMRNAIEDYLHDLNAQRGIDLSFDEIDEVLERTLDIARVRYSA
jgi:type I restriction enzyme R subunit